MQAACADYSILLTTFTFLDARDILLGAARVCKLWQSVAHEQHLWAKLVERDYGAMFSEAPDDWMDMYRRFASMKRFDRTRCHNKLIISEDQAQVQNGPDISADAWRLAVVEGVMRPEDGRLYYCEFQWVGSPEQSSRASGNLMLGVVKHDADPYRFYNGWGFDGSYMVMAHSVNLCCGKPNYNTTGWASNNGIILPGDHVGVFVDNRHKGGADIYYAINGNVRPVAFKGVTCPLSFSLSMCSNAGSPHVVDIVPHPKPPTLPTKEGGTDESTSCN